MSRSLWIVALFVASQIAAVHGDGCCPGCGCHQTKKICVPVREVKKETTYEYTCKCEDFCVPGPSRVVGHCVHKDCNGCEHCCPVREPTCARVRSKVVLVKVPVTKEKCEIKWVVKCVCCNCGRQCGGCSTAGACATEVSSTGTMPGVPPMPPTPATMQTTSAAAVSPVIELLSAEQP